MTKHYHDAAVFFCCSCGGIGYQKDAWPGKGKYAVGLGNVKNNTVFAIDLFEPVIRVFRCGGKIVSCYCRQGGSNGGQPESGCAGSYSSKELATGIVIFYIPGFNFRPR